MQVNGNARGVMNQAVNNFISGAVDVDACAPGALPAVEVVDARVLDDVASEAARLSVAAAERDAG